MPLNIINQVPATTLQKAMQIYIHNSILTPVNESFVPYIDNA